MRLAASSRSLPKDKAREPDLPGLVQRMAERINRLDPERATALWGATYFLMGLKFEDVLIDQLLSGVQNMAESTTYQKVLREGRAQGRDEGRVEGESSGRLNEARSLLRRLGARKFGTPGPDISARLDSLQDLGPLEALLDRVLDQEPKSRDEFLRQA